MVGKKFRNGVEDGLFAPTPPLEAFKLLISMTATVNPGANSKEKAIMVNDVARAFFEAPFNKSCAWSSRQKLTLTDMIGEKQ